MRLIPAASASTTRGIEDRADRLVSTTKSFVDAWMSGVTPSCSQACIVPVRPVPHMISSRIGRTVPIAHFAHGAGQPVPPPHQQSRASSGSATRTPITISGQTQQTLACIRLDREARNVRLVRFTALLVVVRKAATRDLHSSDNIGSYGARRPTLPLTASEPKVFSR